MPNYREVQQNMQELNADGNETRGRYGEDLRSFRARPGPEEDLPIIEQIRKEQAQDPRNG
jgi:hypothetical protein